MRIILNCAEWQTKEQVHLALKEALCFPEYYGNNLDALHDMLSSMPETTLELENTGALIKNFDKWGMTLLRVIIDSGLENKRLSLTLR